MERCADVALISRNCEKDPAAFASLSPPRRRGAAATPASATRRRAGRRPSRSPGVRRVHPDHSIMRTGHLSHDPAEPHRKRWVSASIRQL